MNHKFLDKSYQQVVSNLFTSVFTASEGEKEGKLIGKLAADLSSNIDNEVIICLGSYDKESLIASIFFTPLRFKDPIRVYMLAPVAVSTIHQGKGIGQSLISFGLGELKNRSVDLAITYGDPAFYSKLGFQSLSQDVIQAPLQLSMPQGWLGQSLVGEKIQPVNERPTCVEAFNDPAYW